MRRLLEFVRVVVLHSLAQGFEALRCLFEEAIDDAADGVRRTRFLQLAQRQQ